ncbi:MAG: glycosyltransferase family 2 protein [Methyloceanibacter sp.]|nr:glycosyltransferase family 2 protein [Methyloceanibacter sp.]
MNAPPTVTIITPCLNRAGMIAVAIDSVQEQHFEGTIEHIVMDGGSTDGTLDVLSRYPRITVVSEPDSGLYDALNKGIARAQGDIVGLLNSDDAYRHDAIRKAVEAFAVQPDADMICGGAEVVEGTETERPVIRQYDTLQNRSLQPEDVLLGVPTINARFFRRAVFETFGPFDTRYKVVADRDFLLRATLAGAVAVPIEGVVYAYSSHGGSLTIGGLGARRRIAEETIVMAEDWLRRSPPVSSDVSRSMKRLHAQCMLVCIADCLRQGDLGGAGRWGARASKLNGMWPVDAVAAVGAWAQRRMR